MRAHDFDTILGRTKRWPVENSYSRLISMVSGESPSGPGIHLAEGAPRWVWAAGNDPAAGLGSPWVP